MSWQDNRERLSAAGDIIGTMNIDAERTHW
jgi:hypothetical protein